MNPAFLSAASALAGSSIGAMASLGTAWLTQTYQVRTQRLLQESARREKLFGEFLGEAAKRYGEALASEVTTPVALADLYAMLGKLRLFASRATLAAADHLLSTIAVTYRSPPADLIQMDLSHDAIHDLVHEFTESSRADLRHTAILRGPEKSCRFKQRPIRIAEA